ncbi:MAG: ABC transporter permease [Gordonia sp. (in: high G+C Gram-positive bacteria)]
MSAPEPLEFGRPYRRMLLGVLLAGALIQFLLAMFFLGVVHRPAPHDLPVGVVADDATAGRLSSQLAADGRFAVTRYATTDELTRAVEHRDVYGGLVMTDGRISPWVASSGGSLPAAVLKSTAATINAQLSGTPQATDPDVVPLPAEDSNGASIGSLMQVISLGGAVASLALGRLVPRTPRSLRRGLGHAGMLLAYAVATAGILLGVGAIYGLAASWDIAVSYAWVSLAFTASTAGFVALVGPVGSLSGAIYFLIGSSISGATLPWEFLSPFWSAIGQWLPTGGGAYLLRSVFYFPDAGNGAAHLCLGLYAGLGILIILVVNTLPNPRNRISATDVHLIDFIAGRRAPADTAR